MTREEIVEELKRIVSEIEGDRYTREQLEELINNI
jgi:hypothetical protein